MQAARVFNVDLARVDYSLEAWRYLPPPPLNEGVLLIVLQNNHPIVSTDDPIFHRGRDPGVNFCCTPQRQQWLRIKLRMEQASRYKVTLE